MKTIKFKSSFLLAVLLILILACENEGHENVDEISIQETPTEVKSSYNLLDITPNVYHDYFKQTDHIVGFSSLKANSLSDHSIVKRVNINGDGNIHRLSINNKVVDQLSRSNKLSRSEGQSIYGKTISFTINKVNSSAHGLERSQESEVELYVPDLVEITNPKVSNDEDQYPICYYEDFVVEWNADPNNEEGLVVVAEYFGDNAISENSTNEHIINTDIIDLDDGYAVLNNDLFKDIPNLSIVDLILLRGNVTIEEIEGELYKFFAESHVRLPFVLLKDLNTIAKE